ncbi:Pentatricopeptide repeat-containing protein, chloroplastic [Sesamum alatum]|uniref:Pentatricopeptide repeat-containing protein, chloroplastic n=1 Tax=Sesamum alatum TaxID=300844 RepID=A0AAE2CVT6_9LAMI|nr:Pentatricopeptide repeat-containing protein, chloroplastic [Sesamum alatum]
MRVAMSSSSPLPFPFSSSTIAQTHHRKYSASVLPTAAVPPQLAQQQPCTTSDDANHIDQNSPPKTKTIRFRLSQLCRQGQLHLARQVFDAIPQPTTVLWNTLIIGYVCNNMPHEAISLYSRMFRTINSADDRESDAYTYSSVLKACAETKQLLIAISGLEDIEIANVVYGMVIKLGGEYVNDLFVVSSAITMYADLGCLESARKIFDNCLEKNAHVWNTMIGGYIQNNCPIVALELFNQALEEQDCSQIDDVTFLSALTAASELQQLDVGQQLHSYLIKSSLVSSVILLNAVVALYSRCNSIGDSFNVFSGMQERDVVSWNTIICAFVQNGLDDEGLMLVYEMQKLGFSIDGVTITALLSAASNLRNHKIGKETHAYLIRHGIQFNGMEKQKRSDPLRNLTLVSFFQPCKLTSVPRKIRRQGIQQYITDHWDIDWLGFSPFGHLCTSGIINQKGITRDSGLNRSTHLFWFCIRTILFNSYGDEEFEQCRDDTIDQTAEVELQQLYRLVT